MDLDIDDILADVSRSYNHGQTTSQLSDTDTYTDHQLLTRHWIAERSSPSLLAYPTELLSRIFSRISAQISRIEDFASGSAENVMHYENGYIPQPKSGSQNANFILAILQTDLSRTQFLVRSLLRQRLAKITEFAMYYLTRHLDSDSKTSEIMSDAEISFLRHHQALLSDLYTSSFLNAFPPSLRRLDDSSGGTPMLEPPDGGKAVIVRCLADGTWSNHRDIRNAIDAEIDEGTAATVELSMRRGEIWLVRWRDTKGGWERGELELL
jgi:GINS complex subunit 4